MSEKNPLTHLVAKFVVSTSAVDIPEDVNATSRNHILDGLGVTLAGAGQRAGKIIQNYLEEVGGKPEATIAGTKLRTTMEGAALANGVAGHAMDYDDTQIAVGQDRVTGLLTHPTIPVLTAVLAAGEHVHASGKDFLTAFNIGVEVTCKVAEAIKPDHYRRGFHTTGTVGGFGAAAAAGKLLDLSVDEMERALGIVGSMGAGLRVNFGTMTKPLHSGRAGQNGVLAARLARAGFDSTREMLDSPWGFFQVLGGGCDCDFIKEYLGRPYNMTSPGISIKPYPCGSLAHPTMDAMLEMRQDHGIEPLDIDSIDVAVATNVLDALRYPSPANPLEAKFCLPFGITLIALKGKAGVNEYTQQVVDDPEVRGFMQKVHCFVDEGIEAKGYDKMYGKVEVHLRNGNTLSKEAEIARGYPEKPMSRKELSAKFIECALLSLSAEKAKRIVKLVLDQMDELEDLELLTSLVSTKQK